MYFDLVINLADGFYLVMIQITAAKLGIKVPFPLRNAVSHIKLNSEIMVGRLLNSEVF